LQQVGHLRSQLVVPVQASPLSGRDHPAVRALGSKFGVSCRDLAEMMQGRGINVGPSTLFRWVQRCALEIEKRDCRYQGSRSGPWRLNEAYGPMDPLQTLRYLSSAYASDTFRRCTMFKGRDFDRSVILLCVRWYLAYSLSLWDLEEMMAERGISVDPTTIHRWTIHFTPLLLERFNRRKRPVMGRWHIDETYVKVGGRWAYLYR
jgi:transposase-like protein